ncbi:RNA-directed DNA polymerase, eukaryota [Tanacetum coccineum]|uniref:RNA-directed DNA polymerase, eukaryota n=1 Tax=Tanacetum coccineum TaxID=301880 RepID=A0ABQ5DY17_9ASTR
MGSVLVNGSPTLEFQFHKGLKQGDPLSPYLCILIMESLHLSFGKILNVGLFKGITIDESLTISHLFYADDAVFIGEWDTSNINIIVKVVKYFYMALGLKINIQKSKLMGVGVHSDEVASAARLVGGDEDDQQNILQARVTDLILPQKLDNWTWSLDAASKFGEIGT